MAAPTQIIVRLLNLYMLIVQDLKIIGLMKHKAQAGLEQVMSTTITGI